MILALLLVGGCDRSKADLLPIAEENETLKKSERDLLALRGTLLRQRKELTEERGQLAEQLRATAPTDRERLQVLSAQEHAITSRERELTSQETELSRKLDTLLADRTKLVERVTAVPSASPEERAAHREHAVAGREHDLATREREVAAREQVLATREQALAKREKETCGAPAQVVMPKFELPKGFKYGRDDVEPIYQRALKAMRERGLLTSDLPGGGKLVSVTTQAMQAGDYVHAKYSAEQLMDEIESIAVDRNFITAKMARLGQAMRGHHLEGETKRQSDALFQEATAAYGDGKFAAANQKINRIVGLIK